ncbi:helix-turn-helix domain-containing protein [Deminuibacter soli]|uniref:AraC family transcriptional regulator n=1 Tax=Deminuibacter soli TaxID=2291815 RepID=A0A3E1NE94_9BACT|nr:helix-turn-helix domain-containing protein [Deminuibacter soli]RFM26151.1 AraC family transcriptional regulator [Deminuibacter soli]
MNYIILLGVFQSLIALLLLPASQQKRPANELLRWLLACICVHLTLKFLIFTTGHYTEMRRGFNTFIGLAYGPLLWMFAQKLRDDRYRPAKHWYCFLPAIASSVVYLFIATYTVINHGEPLVVMHWYNTFTLYASIASIIYPIMSLPIARSLASFWNIERRLLTQLSAGLLLLCCLAIFGLLLPMMPGIDMDKAGITIRVIAYAGLLLGCVLIIQYEVSLYRILGKTIDAAEPVASVTEPLIVANETLTTAVPIVPAVAEVIPSAEEICEEVNLTPTRKLLLAEDQQQALMNRLTGIMEQQKPYTDAALSLEKLAALLKIPRNQASELINHCTGKSFYQYINEYRIKEVILLLDKCSRQQIVPNILSLAFDAGFHSKSSFNLYFKKVTGHTPSAWLKKDKPALHAAEAFTVITQKTGAAQYC